MPVRERFAKKHERSGGGTEEGAGKELRHSCRPRRRAPQEPSAPRRQRARERESGSIDAFGVGTRMGVSADAPSLEIAYKLAEFAGHGRVKLAPGKAVLPGRKQVFRAQEGGVYVGDTIARADETLAGTPLLHQVMKAGVRTAREKPLADIQAYAEEQIAALPPAVRRIAAAKPAYPVSVSPALSDYKRRVEAAIAG